MWRSEEKLIMSDIQTGLINLWFIGLDLLTPDEASISLGDIIGTFDHQYQKLHKIWSRISTWIAREQKDTNNNMEMIHLTEPTASNHRNNNNIVSTDSTKIMVATDNNILEDSGLCEDLELDSSRVLHPLPGFA